MLREHEVGGSNPPFPTSFFITIKIIYQIHLKAFDINLSKAFFKFLSIYKKLFQFYAFSKKSSSHVFLNIDWFYVWVWKFESL